MHRRNLLIPALLLCAALLLSFFDPPLLQNLRLSVFDTYQQLGPRTYPTVPVRVVAIDDASLDKSANGPGPARRLPTC